MVALVQLSEVSVVVIDCMWFRLWRDFCSWSCGAFASRMIAAPLVTCWRSCVGVPSATIEPLAMMMTRSVIFFDFREDV